MLNLLMEFLAIVAMVFSASVGKTDCAILCGILVNMCEIRSIADKIK